MMLVGQKKNNPMVILHTMMLVVKAYNDVSWKRHNPMCREAQPQKAYTDVAWSEEV